MAAAPRPAHHTFLHGALGNDTIVSGLGNDDIFGDAGSNILAYASVEQEGLDIVNRGTNGVTAKLPNAGLTATGGKTGGPEQDTIHSDIGTLVGSNGNDVLQGNDLGNQILGVAPAGTAGVQPGPAGNDAIIGNGGNDLMFGAEGNDSRSAERATTCFSASAATTSSSARPAPTTSTPARATTRTSPGTASPRRSTVGRGPTASRPTRSTRSPRRDCETFSTAAAAAAAAERVLQRKLSQLKR